MTTMTKMSMQEAIGADTLGKPKDGAWIARWEFYYRHGKTAETFAGIVTKAIPGATIINSGEVWKSFRGGASTAASSHWYVTFTIDNTKGTGR